MCFSIISFCYQDELDSENHRPLCPPLFSACGRMSDKRPCVQDEPVSIERFRASLSHMLNYKRNEQDVMLDTAISLKFMANPEHEEIQWITIPDLGLVYFIRADYAKIVVDVEEYFKAEEEEENYEDEEQEADDENELRQEIQQFLDLPESEESEVDQEYADNENQQYEPLQNVTHFRDVRFNQNAVEAFAFDNEHINDRSQSGFNQYEYSNDAHSLITQQIFYQFGTNQGYNYMSQNFFQPNQPTGPIAGHGQGPFPPSVMQYAEFDQDMPPQMARLFPPFDNSLVGPYSNVVVVARPATFGQPSMPPPHAVTEPVAGAYYSNHGEGYIQFSPNGLLGGAGLQDLQPKDLDADPLDNDEAGAFGGAGNGGEDGEGGDGGEDEDAEGESDDMGEPMYY